jgi:hypothetical protein
MSCVMLIAYGALKAFKEPSWVLPEFLKSECENESEWIALHGLRGSFLYGRSSTDLIDMADSVRACLTDLLFFCPVKRE